MTYHRVLFPGAIEGALYFKDKMVLCEAVAAVCLITCFCSLLNIGAISFNRYIHICHNQLYAVGRHLHEWGSCGTTPRYSTHWKPEKCHDANLLVISGTHYCEVIMGAIASQITNLTIVYSIVYSDADQRKHQSSASLAFVRGIYRGPVNSPHKRPVTR